MLVAAIINLDVLVKLVIVIQVVEKAEFLADLLVVVSNPVELTVDDQRLDSDVIPKAKIPYSLLTAFMVLNSTGLALAV